MNAMMWVRDRVREMLETLVPREPDGNRSSRGKVRGSGSEPAITEPAGTGG